MGEPEGARVADLVASVEMRSGVVRRLLAAAAATLWLAAVARVVWRHRRPDGRPLSVVLFTTLAKPVLWAAVRIEIDGRLPAHGAVLASNHPNYLDGPLMMAVDPRIRPVAKPQASPIVRLGLRWSGSMIIGRGAGSDATDHLRRGGMVWVAPEGHRTGEWFGGLRLGPARIAAGASVPLIPVAIHYREPDGHFAGPGPVGTVGPRLRAWRPWKRPGVRVTFGAPIWPRPGSERAATASLRRALAELTGVPLAEGSGPAGARTAER